MSTNEAVGSLIQIEEHNLKRVAKDLLVGSLAGGISIFLTQPIDTVRVIFLTTLLSLR